mmetsp:Transcript_138238/g.441746  ORF Transcript_138238/g.441746 Transcript_138238/m.441746 type:complete len:312 (-) Transcript_138238:1452-2387(-)
MMPKLARLGKILGPRKLKPSPLACFQHCSKRSPYPSDPPLAHPHAEMESHKRWVLFSGLTSFFLSIAMLYQMSPFFQKYARVTTGATPDTVGLIFAVLPFSAFVFSVPAMGFIARHGPRVALASGLLLLACSSLMFGLSDTVSGWFFWRAVQGAATAPIYSWRPPVRGHRALVRGCLRRRGAPRPRHRRRLRPRAWPWPRPPAPALAQAPGEGCAATASRCSGPRSPPISPCASGTTPRGLAGSRSWRPSPSPRRPPPRPPPRPEVWAGACMGRATRGRRPPPRRLPPRSCRAMGAASASSRARSTGASSM